MVKHKLLLSSIVFVVIGTFFLYKAFYDPAPEDTVLQEYVPVKDEFATQEEYNLAHPITETISDRDELGLFTALIEEAGLQDYLMESESVTVLAPTNDAFELIAPQELAQIRADNQELKAFVSNHILKGSLSLEDIKIVSKVTTIENVDLDVTVDESGAISIQNVPVGSGDYKAKNGIMHILEGAIFIQN